MSVSLSIVHVVVLCVFAVVILVTNSVSAVGVFVAVFVVVVATVGCSIVCSCSRVLLMR